MSAAEDWLYSGQGNRPTLRWSFTTDAPLVDLQLSRETGEIVASDISGGLYLLDRGGHIRALTRTAHELRKLAWADDGSVGATLIDDEAVGCFDRRLQFRWTRELPQETLAVALSPLGSHLAVSMANARNVVYDVENRRVGKFESLRPLLHLQFVADAPELVVAAEHACFARYKLTGENIWMQKLWSNVGDLAVTGNGRQIFLAGFAYGIQAFDGEGSPQGSFVMEGTTKLIASTYLPRLLLAATLERQLLCVDAQGNLRWMLELPDDAVRIGLSPLGDWLICGFASGRVVRLDQA
jgi:hypothetical protein